MFTQFKLTKKLAIKVLQTVDAGLCRGLGEPVPGKMCIEAAVCYAMGLEHSDNPTCVSPALRSLKISLNDKNWSSNTARSKGLRKLAILQLGTADNFNEQEFIKRLVDLTIRKTVPTALIIASKLAVTPEHKKALELAAKRCKKEGTKESAADAADAAYAAYAANAAYAAAANAAYAAAAAAAAANAAYAAYAAAAADAAAAAANAAYDAAAAAYAARDKILSEFAEDVSQILIDMKVPAVKYLNLLEDKQ